MSGSILTRMVTGFSKPERLVKKANRYEDSGNHMKAFELRKECYEYCVSHLGEEAPETLTHLMNLAIVHARRADVKEAGTLMQKCYAMRLRLLGEAHPDTERARKYCETIDKIKETEDLLHRTGKHR